VRSRALDTLEQGPEAILPILAGMALIVAALGLLLIFGESASGPQPGVNGIAKVCLAALACLGIAGLAGAVALRRRRAVSTPASAPLRRDTLSALMLAATALLPVLLIPVHYLAARTHPSPLQWNSYGFLDKRWLTSLFLISTLGVVLLVAVASRVVTTARARPGSWREWLQAMAPADLDSADGPDAVGTPRSRRWLSAGLKVLCAVVVATYFFGPPWNLPSRPLDYHETNTMGGVQAIGTGSLPYIDAAAVQYGPGAQVADYAYVHATGHLSVDGFREATLIFNWLAAILFLAALYVRAGPVVAAVTTVVAVTVFPTLQMFGFDARGFVQGFWGWGNTLRYAGVFLLAMLFPAVLSRVRAGRLPGPGSVALGGAWAVLCLVAQENLIGGAFVVGVMSVLLVATRTAGRRAVLSGLMGVAAGFLLVVLPVLAYYGVNGRLGRFLELYWLVPQAVASGYSNSRFPNADWSPYFKALPILLLVLLVAAILTRRPFRVASEWSQRRVVLVSALVAAVVCHLGALTRSDVPHLKNTELALPAAICLAVFYLPELLGFASRRGRVLGGLAIAVVVLGLLPLSPYSSQPKLVALKLWRPLHARISPPRDRPIAPSIDPRSLAAKRMGRHAVSARTCCTKRPIPMHDVVSFMNRLHQVVGQRRVFVDSVKTKTITPPAVYFLADLRPFTTPQDFGTMAFNSELKKQWFAYYAAHLRGAEALVTRDPQHRASRMWVAAFPRHRTVSLPLGRDTVRVFLR
jgi:hypothetical protein